MKKLTAGISIFAMFALAFTFAGGASADMSEWNLDGAAVLNFNNATVVNGVTSFANTGDNELEVEAEGNGKNIAKNARINTGDAASVVGLVNQVNYNGTVINQRSLMMDDGEFMGECGCEGLDIALVGNFNNAMVSNSVVSGANTGDNELEVEAEGNGRHGHGLNRANGGVMNTGDALSWVEATNLVNTNITRIVQ